MDRIARSLWLPVGPANFFSVMTDPTLLEQSSTGPTGPTGRCWADRPYDSGHVPHLRESVFRRLVEVLPPSFGYEPEGRCGFSAEHDDPSRPDELVMVLRPGTATVGVHTARAANTALAEAGVRTVELTVDEQGFYTFVATGPTTAADLDAAGEPAGWGEALTEHIVAVFGGAFTVNRLQPSADRHRVEGRDAVRDYNGLPPAAPSAAAAPEPARPPRGALSFFQLNIMIEGLCNPSLLPSVFFEHYEQARRWLAENRRGTSIITDLDDYLREIVVAADATSPVGQIGALHRFLLISRGSLQWMRRSVESVRRSLLDQMMAVSHRQARLIQLDLAGVEYERTPEMTGEATESQMRGYVMLIATKLPLIAVIADTARTATDAVNRRINSPVAPSADLLGVRGDELAATVAAWTYLFERLGSNVVSLETAVEHDWQERLLFEQEQARSEQEAMAEIERSRRGRPQARRVGDAAYNAIMLILTAITVFIAIQTANTPTSPGRPVWQQALALWPVLLLGVAVLVTWPSLARLRQLVDQRRPNSELYSFEFAFRLDERVEPERLSAFLAGNDTTHVTAPAIGRMQIRRLGGWRWERISTDTTLIKIHSVAVARIAALRHARFEIVTEIMMRKISNTEQLFLRQCRMFGDSPVALDTAHIGAIVKELLRQSCCPLSPELDPATLTDPIDLLSQPAGPTVTIPRQRDGSHRHTPGAAVSSPDRSGRA